MPTFKKAIKLFFLVALFFMYSTVYSQIKLEEDFEDGLWNGGNVELHGYCSECITFVAPGFGARRGKTAMRVRWERRFYDSAVRSSKSSEANAAIYERIPWGSEAWVGFSVYLPDKKKNGFRPEYTNGAFIFQIIGYSPCAPSNKTGAIWVGDGGSEFGWYNNQTVETYKSLTSDLSRGQWHDFVIHFKTDLSGNTGFYQVYLDGDRTPKAAQSNIQLGNGGECSGGVYLKFGTYQYAGSDYVNRVLYFDEIRYGVGNVGYDAVAPRSDNLVSNSDSQTKP